MEVSTERPSSVRARVIEKSVDSQTESVNEWKRECIFMQVYVCIVVCVCIDV